jgi:acetoin utilization deacetylase AcuC-like enzyme
MKVVFHDDFYRVYTSDPASEAGRMEAVMEVIEDKVELVQARSATAEEIEAVHSDRHIKEVERMNLHPIAALAAGGAIQTAVIGMEEPCFGLIRPPGHHASSDSAWGFCFYNNMAVAMEHLKRNKMITTAYVLDFDLHFGDGNVNILKNRGYCTIFNPDSSDRLSYMNSVIEEIENCTADVIGISAGFDNHEQDWGGLLKTEDYYRMGAVVRKTALARGAGFFAILEGGYNHRVLGRNVWALIQGMDGK